MIEWISENWATVVAVAGALHVLATVIVNVTPTPKDNELYAKLYSWIEKLAGVFTKKAKE